MFNLLKYREQQNLTQEELAEKSGLSVRTIQRIEAGTAPKGYTLKVLARALGISTEELTEQNGSQTNIQATDWAIAKEDFSQETGERANSKVRLIKLINLSSLPFTFLPPLNIIVPLLIVFYKKEKNPETKQILSIQILWTILAIVIFMLGVFIRKWFGLGNTINSVTMFGSILCNVFIILKNSAGIASTGKLSLKLNFNLL